VARVRGLVAAWNRGDAAAFGEAFTRSATYVTGAGRVVRGRAAIAALLAQPAARVRIIGGVDVHRGEEAAVARFGWRSPGPHRSGRGGVITCALARDGTSWLIRRLTNEEPRAPRARRATARG
jgi:hypothetical protein